MNKIPIVLASDENYAQYMYVTILSALDNKNQNTQYEITCLVDSSVKEKTKNKFYKLSEKYKNSEIKFIDMDKSFDNLVMQIEHITEPTYYRLKMPELFKDYNKIIYLDTDVIVKKDLTEYYNTDIEEFYIAGVPAFGYISDNSNREYYKNIGLNDLSHYINAGVTLWNLNKIRNDNKIQELYSLVKRNFKSMDQDIVNVCFQNGIKKIELKYNLMTSYKDLFSRSNNPAARPEDIYGKDNIAEAFENPVIIHYANKIKPWDNKNVWFADSWWEYAKKSPFNFWFNKNIFSISKNSKRTIIKILGLKIKIKKRG